MRSCGEVEKRIAELAALRPTEVPAEIREHLAGCPACRRALAAARLGRGLLAAAADAPEPPAEFADRVLAALPGTRPSRPETEMWRLGWGLVPAFAATVAVLVILYQFQNGALPGPIGLVSMEELSAGERIVLEAAPPEPDLVLTAVMEGGGT
jgi:predicted anti-sigma-YlaC factor YlaD